MAFELGEVITLWWWTMTDEQGPSTMDNKPTCQYDPSPKIPGHWSNITQLGLTLGFSVISTSPRIIPFPKLLRLLYPLSKKNLHYHSLQSKMGSSDTGLNNDDDSATVSDESNTETDSDTRTETDEECQSSHPPSVFVNDEKVLAFHSGQYYEAKVIVIFREGWIFVFFFSLFY